MKLPRRTKIALWSLVSLAPGWLLGDFLYSRVMAGRIARWEVAVQRDENGVQKDRQAFTLEGKGAGRDSAVLFIHGLNATPLTWSKMAPELNQQFGFTCRAMRLPGFAEPTEEYARSDRAQWIAAVEREVAALRREHEQVYIVGHSLGGAIAIGCLLENPDLADAVVLIAPAVEVSNARSPLLSTKTCQALANRLLLFTTVTQTPFEIDAHDPAQRDPPGRTLFTPRPVVDELFALLEENRGRAGEFQTRLMMVLSKDDQVVDHQAAQRFLEEAASPTKRAGVRFMEDAGHQIPLDHGWKELTREIGLFFAGGGST